MINTTNAVSIHDKMTGGFGKAIVGDNVIREHVLNLQGPAHCNCRHVDNFHESTAEGSTCTIAQSEVSFHIPDHINVHGSITTTVLQRPHPPE